MSVVLDSTSSQHLDLGSNQAEHAFTPPITVGMFIKLDLIENNPNYQYPWGYGTYFGTPSCPLLIYPDTHGSYPNRAMACPKDTDGDYTIVRSSTSPGASSSWQHLMLTITSGGIATMYHDNVSVGSGTNAAIGTIFAAYRALWIGGASSGTCLNGKVAEWFKVGAVATSEQRADLQTKPVDQVITPTLYVPCKSDYAEKMIDMAVSAPNGCEVDSDDHPVSYGVKPASVFASPVFHSPVVQGA